MKRNENPANNYDTLIITIVLYTFLDYIKGAEGDRLLHSVTFAWYSRSETTDSKLTLTSTWREVYNHYVKMWPANICALQPLFAFWWHVRRNDVLVGKYWSIFAYQRTGQQQVHSSATVQHEISCRSWIVSSHLQISWRHSLRILVMLRVIQISPNCFFPLHISAQSMNYRRICSSIDWGCHHYLETGFTTPHPNAVLIYRYAHKCEPPRADLTPLSKPDLKQALWKWTTLRAYFKSHHLYK